MVSAILAARHRTFVLVVTSLFVLFVFPMHNKFLLLLLLLLIPLTTNARRWKHVMFTTTYCPTSLSDLPVESRFGRHPRIYYVEMLLVSAKRTRKRLQASAKSWTFTQDHAEPILPHGQFFNRSRIYVFISHLDQRYFYINGLGSWQRNALKFCLPVFCIIMPPPLGWGH